MANELPRMTSPNIQEIRYFFVWTEETGQDPRPYDIQKGQKSRISIFVPSNHQEENIIHQCTAKFQHGFLKANFTCDYHPSTETLSNFGIVKATRTGGMEAATMVIISFERHLGAEEFGVADENGNPFMFVLLEFGEKCGFPILCDIWGKKALPSLEAKDVVVLSEKERADLQLDVWGKAEQEVHWAFVAMGEREKRKEEQAELERKEKEEKQAGTAEADVAAAEKGWVVVTRGKK